MYVENPVEQLSNLVDLANTVLKISKRMDRLDKLFHIKTGRG